MFTLLVQLHEATFMILPSKNIFLRHAVLSRVTNPNKTLVAPLAPYTMLPVDFEGAILRDLPLLLQDRACPRFPDYTLCLIAEVSERAIETSPRATTDQMLWMSVATTLADIERVIPTRSREHSDL
jgi:hypothetical protein